MTTKPTPPTLAEIREFLTQEELRWTAAHVDAVALQLAVMGIGHVHGKRNDPLWHSVVVLDEKLRQLAEACERNQILIAKQLAALGVPPAEATTDRLH